MHNKTLPTLNIAIIKCTVHYIAHLECIFSLVRMKVMDSDVLASSSRDNIKRGQRRMNQVLGTFGLLDFTMLWPVLTWRVLKLMNHLFL
jgi:hypothetical protein